jgi:hypothetical protein
MDRKRIVLTETNLTDRDPRQRSHGKESLGEFTFLPISFCYLVGFVEENSFDVSVYDADFDATRLFILSVLTGGDGFHDKR